MTYAHTLLKRAVRGLLLVAILGMLVAAQKAQAQTFTTLYGFTGGFDGGTPSDGIVLDAQGDVYGTTQSGGAGRCKLGCGTLFKLTPNGTETVIYSFPAGAKSGASPGLIWDTKGNLYGTTIGTPKGPYGAVFELTNQAKAKWRYLFKQTVDGDIPDGVLFMDTKGNLYGTTLEGGAYGDGTVFQVTPKRIETVLHSFGSSGSDGMEPLAGLVSDLQGNLYGTTLLGGSNDVGTVYKITPGGTETVIYNFSGEMDGAGPSAGMIFDAQSNLYGTTLEGGGGSLCSKGVFPGCGTVFKLDPNGTETVLYRFTGGADGAGPLSLVLDNKGNLYGTTVEGGASNRGTVYEITAAGTEEVLYSFTGGTDGQFPGNLVMDSQGNLYGTTSSGGGYVCQQHGCGTVFKLKP